MSGLVLGVNLLNYPYGTISTICKTTCVRKESKSQKSHNAEIFYIERAQKGKESYMVRYSKAENSKLCTVINGLKTQHYIFYGLGAQFPSFY